MKDQKYLTFGSFLEGLDKEYKDNKENVSLCFEVEHQAMNYQVPKLFLIDNLSLNFSYTGIAIYTRVGVTVKDWISRKSDTIDQKAQTDYISLPKEIQEIKIKLLSWVYEKYAQYELRQKHYSVFKTEKVRSNLGEMMKTSGDYVTSMKAESEEEVREKLKARSKTEEYLIITELYSYPFYGFELLELGL